MNQVPVPTVSDVSLYVQAVATRAPTDAWAVGSAVTGTYPYRQRPLVEHWNGRRWSIGASAPAPGGGLDAVSADAADDGWAVGGYIPSGASALQPLVEHWDGTSWMRITAPPSGYDEQLTGVSAGSPTDVWVTGVGDDASFIDHWDGAKWSGGPVTSVNAALRGVTRVNADDVWIAGSYFCYTCASVSWQPITLHWDGTAVRRIATPIVGVPNAGDGVQVSAISAAGGTDVWAVGSFAYLSPDYSKRFQITCTMHWNGSKWSIVRSPSPNPALQGTVDDTLTSVSAVGGVAFAVGQETTFGVTLPPVLTLILGHH